MSPAGVFSNVCPLATLLVRADSQLAPETTGYLDEIFVHCSALSSSIAIEFAFRCLQNDSGDVNDEFLCVFLNRVTSVELDWDELRSPMMLDILQDVVSDVTPKNASKWSERLRLRRNHTKGSFGCLYNADVENSDGDKIALAEAVLREGLKQVKKGNAVRNGHFLCGHTVTMPVRPLGSRDGTRLEAFVTMLPKLLNPVDLIARDYNEVIHLQICARECVMKARYCSIILEDALTCGKMFIDAPPSFYSAFAGVFGATVGRRQLTTYQDVVNEFALRLGHAEPSATLVAKEAFVAAYLPSEIGELSLPDLMVQKSTLFARPPAWKALFDVTLPEMTMFYLKTIYHCMHLRRLRKKITLVTIAGAKNAGKTTLNFEIFGEDVVKARMGTALEETTVYPSAYFLPDQPGLIFCDLPGCSDADTAEMCDLFVTLGDVSVFLLMPNTAANHRMGDPLQGTISTILQCKGPRLICINHADHLLKRGKTKKERDEYDASAKLKKEREVWLASKLFGTVISGCQEDTKTPKWKCEEERPDAVVASIKTVDSALSVWLTSFDPQVERETAIELLFSAAHVREWVEEVQGMVKAVNADSV